jgi:excisionase family DNA binding protein
MPNAISQFELFEAFDPMVQRAPKLELPFQRTQEIDTERAASILGVSKKTLRRILEKQLIRAYRTGDHKAPWRIEYSAVVEYCDKLRVQYCISDKRVGLSASRRRYRDHELLPFPLDQTIYVAEVRERLKCSHEVVVHLIESGSLVGYQLLFEQQGSPWRIHEPSLDRYIASLHAMSGKMSGKGTSSRPAAPSR